MSIEQIHLFKMCQVFIVNDIRNFVFGLAEATVYGFCKSQKQKFVMLFTIAYCKSSIAPAHWGKYYK